MNRPEKWRGRLQRLDVGLRICIGYSVNVAIESLHRMSGRHVTLGAVVTTLLVATMIATTTWLRLVHKEGAPEFLPLIGWQVLVWLPWVLGIYPVAFLAKRLPVDHRPIFRVPVHLVAAIVLALVHAAWYAVVCDRLSPLSGMPDTKWGVYRFFFISWFHLDLLMYWGFHGLTVGAMYLHRLLERQRVEAILKVELLEARMQALRLQIEPHFLFNSLNTIVSMQRAGLHDKALQTTLALSDLLRWLLSAKHDQKVRLNDELHFLERYLLIEGFRFEDRLQVNWDVEHAARSALLPSFVLQPIVENAVRHSVGKSTALVEIGVLAAINGEQLLVEISNQCNEEQRGTLNEGLGIGLANIRSRLEYLYEEKFDLNLESDSERTTVRLHIPHEESFNDPHTRG